MKIIAVKGMNDILPEATVSSDSVKSWQLLEEKCRCCFDVYGFREIRTPVVEETGLFARSIGEGTDIVGKEMYTFSDRKGKKSLSLRPEGTAGAVRAYIQHSVHLKDPVTKWWYFGPMYRYERVQAGRYRQFYQTGAEVFGSKDPYVDAELLVMADRLLRKELEISDMRLLINSLGDEEDRRKYVDILRNYLKPNLSKLCDDCNRRYEKNTLRILDCKVKSCRPLLEKAPEISGSISEEAGIHFRTVLDLLDKSGVEYELSPRLVRGLDYYNRTCFEFIAGGLGAHDAICSGGRYDGLVKKLGGPDIPAIGFAMGVERLLLLNKDKKNEESGPEIFFVSLDESSKQKSFMLMEKMRFLGIYAEMDPRGGSVKSQMRRADKMNAAYAVVIGESELKEGAARVKDLSGRNAESDAVPFDELAGFIREKLKKS